MNIAAATIVTMTLHYTDERFTLIAITLELIALIAGLSFVAHKLGLYVSEFLVENILFILGLMAPSYLFQFFQQGLSASPAPEWFEAIAYIVVVIVIVLIAMARTASKLWRSFTAAFDSQD